MRICYFINSKNEIEFAKKLKETLKEKNVHSTLVFFDSESKKILIKDDIYYISNFTIKEASKLFSYFKFNLIQVSIFSPLYFFALKLSRKNKTIFLVDCNDFSANFYFPQAIKKSSTILSYTYYQTMLTFVDNLLVSSIVGKRRIEDMGLNKTIFTLSPCFDYFYLNKKTNDTSFRTKKDNKDVILMDTSLFNSEEVIDFINEIKKLDFLIPCLIIDSSSTDFASLYSVDQKYIFSSKDFNRSLIYRNATYLYSRQGKVDDFDLLLANKMNLPVISNFDELISKKIIDKKQIINENKLYVLNEFTFQKYVDKLMEVYSSLARRNY